MAGAALVQVGASPIRLDISDERFNGFRYGHALAENNADVSRIHVATVVRPVGQITNIRTKCKGMKNRLQQKAIELSNAFRQALGLPTIEPTEAVTILPIGPPSFVTLSPVDQEEHHGHPHHHPHHAHHRHHHKRPGGCHQKGFLRRIHVALTALSPWEGRAVAFVLGCGIGVLLRMFWVLAVISYRAIKGNSEEEHEYTEILFVEEAEPEVPAPAYSDVKTEAISAPATDAKN